MTDILDRLTAAVEEADAGTDALGAEYLATAMDSVRDLLDGSNGGYVAPQNRAEMPRLITGPAGVAPSARITAIQVTATPAFVAVCREFNQTVGRAMQQVVGNLQRARTMARDDFEEQA